MSRRFALFIDRYATRIAAVIDLVTGYDPKEAAAKYAATKRPMWKTVAPVDESYRIAVARALSCRFKYSNLNDEALIKIAKALPEGEASHIAREAGWNPDLNFWPP